MLTLALALAALPQEAEALSLPALFSDGLVLQRETRAPLWGWARPGAEVELAASWEGGRARATADAEGRFRAELATPAPGGPFEIRVTSGGAERVLSDVLVGEVWLASGQSNMEWRLSDGVEGGAEAVRAAEDPELRFFTVADALAPAPRADLGGRWLSASPASAPGFSACAYFFARRLRAELGVPVGIVSAEWGGTPAESWMRAEALAPFPEFAAELARQAEHARDPAGAAARLAEARARYWERALALDRARLAPALEEDASEPDWPAVVLPTPFERHGLGHFDGCVWYRRTLELPPDWAGRALALELGRIDDRDTVFWNGARVGGHEDDPDWRRLRRYAVPAERVRAGRNALLVRVLDTGGLGGFVSEPDALRLAPADAPADALALAGSWRWAAGTPLAELGPPPPEPFEPIQPAVLWNAMIAPLVPAAIRGVIWYQGESNRTRAGPYARLFPALIRDWRAAFRQPEMPFYFVQIAPFAYPLDRGEAGALRDAQRRALALPNTGMAVTMDVGDRHDPHPKRKREVGERLALWALAGTYRRPIEHSGPLYCSMRVEGGSIRVEFEHGEGLTARGEPVRHVTIAGSDGVFHPAEARIEGATLVAWSPAVPRPLALRFGWGAADETNLWNAAGLPAASFRTDDWP